MPATGEQHLDEADAYPRQDLGIFPLKNEKKDPMPWRSRLGISDKPPHYKSVSAESERPPEYPDSRYPIWHIAEQRAIDERRRYYHNARVNPYKKSPSVIEKHLDHGSNRNNWVAW